MKRVLEYLPLLTIALITIAYADLHSYFKEINVPIYNYIETSELILSFVPKLFNNLFIVINIITLYFIYLKYKPSIENATARQVIKLENIILITCTFLIFLLIALELRIPVTSKNIVLYKIGIIVSTAATYLIIFVFVNKDMRRHKSLKTHGYIIGLLSFLYIVSGVYWLSYMKAYEKKLLKNTPNIAFSYDSRYIESDSVNLLFGETVNYIFMYNIKDSITSVYRKNNIESISYGETPFKKIDTTKKHSTFILADSIKTPLSESHANSDN